MAQANGDLPPIDIKHHHTAISVPDLNQALDWYSKALGFELEFTFALPHINAEAAVHRSPGPCEFLRLWRLPWRLFARPATPESVA